VPPGTASAHPDRSRVNYVGHFLRKSAHATKVKTLSMPMN